MKNLYWCDDKHEKMVVEKEILEEHGFKLFCFKSANGVLDALRANPYEMGALLLDIQILENENDTTEANRHVITLLNGLKTLNVEVDPVFFTGQIEQNKQEFDFIQKVLEGKTIIDKSKANAIIKVVSALDEKLSDRLIIKVQNQFPGTFKLFTQTINQKQSLKPFEDYIEKSEFNKSNLNDLRQSLECVYAHLAEFEILPSSVYTKSTDGGAALRFLSGQPTNSKNSGPIFTLTPDLRVNANVCRWLQNHFYTTSLASHFPDDNYGLREIEVNAKSDLRAASVGTLYFFEEIAQYFNYWIPFVKGTETYIHRDHYSKEDTLTGDVIAHITAIKSNYAFCQDDKNEQYFIPPTLFTQVSEVGQKFVISYTMKERGNEVTSMEPYA